MPSGQVVLPLSVGNRRQSNVLIWQLSRRGFGSEINLMLLAILYCIKNEYAFWLCSKYSNISCRAGWTDYFLPFCRTFDHPSLQHCILFSPPSPLVRRVLVTLQKLTLLPTLRRWPLITPDIFPRIWNPAFAEQWSAPEGGRAKGDVFAACQEILKGLWRLNPTTLKAIAIQRARLASMATPFAVLHVRRGDKRTEAESREVGLYVEKAMEVDSAVRTYVVMTDDYAVVAELRARFPGREFVTLCGKEKKGHDQAAFNRMSAAERRRETDLLLTELTLAQESSFFVGTFSSNIGRLVALMRGLGSTYSVDIPYTMFR